MIKRIKFTTVPVTDLDRAVAFYSKTLGLRVFTDQSMGPDQRWVELQLPAGDTMLVLSTFPTAAPPPNVPALVLACDKLQPTYEQLRERGVVFTQEPKKASWGESAMFKDSEGNLILLGT